MVRHRRPPRPAGRAATPRRSTGRVGQVQHDAHRGVQRPLQGSGPRRRGVAEDPQREPAAVRRDVRPDHGEGTQHGGVVLQLGQGAILVRQWPGRCDELDHHTVPAGRCHGLGHPLGQRAVVGQQDAPRPPQQADHRAVGRRPRQVGEPVPGRDLRPVLPRRGGGLVGAPRVRDRDRRRRPDIRGRWHRGGPRSRCRSRREPGAHRGRTEVQHPPHAGHDRRDGEHRGPGLAHPAPAPGPQHCFEQRRRRLDAHRVQLRCGPGQRGPQRCLLLLLNGSHRGMPPPGAGPAPG
jgi:hypothetical protein